MIPPLSSLLTADRFLGLAGWEEEITFPESSEWLDYNKMNLNRQLQQHREQCLVQLLFLSSLTLSFGCQVSDNTYCNSSTAPMHMVLY